MSVSRLKQALKRFAGDRGGGFATMAATFLPIALMVSAFAVDRGSLLVEKDNLQSLADLAAITAGANLTKASTAATLAITDNESVTVSLSAAGSTYDPTAHTTDQIDMIVEPGRYTGKTSVAVDSRFQAGATPYNAVRVKLRKSGTLYFAQPFMKTPLIETSAVAAVPAQAAFSIGSRLASLNGGTLNSLLNSLLGTNISLSAMDYEALLRTDVSALDFVKALGTRIGVTAGTYNDVLDATVSAGQLASAIASVSGSNQTAQLALNTIVTSAPITANIPLRSVIDLGDLGRLGLGEKAQGFDVGVNAMDLLTAGAAIAGGKTQASVNLGTSIPGLLNLKLDIAIGEPPQNSPFYAVGEAGTYVRTAQTRVVLSAEVPGPGAIPGLGTLLNPLLIAAVKIPLYAEVAYAEARLTDVSCPTGRPDSLKVTIAARPGVADLYIGEVDPAAFRTFETHPTVSPAKIADITLLGIPVLRILGSAQATITNNAETMLTWNKAEIDAKTVKTVSTTDLTQTLTSSLLGKLKLTPQVLTLTLDITPLTSLIKGLISPVTPALDGVLNSVLGIVGLKLGQADVRVYGATCGRSVLVQ